MDRARNQIAEQFKRVLEIEAEAISALARSFDSNSADSLAYIDAVMLLQDCKGKVVVTGVGKSGLIARKVGATLSSTGTASVFLHPTDGLHGDVGLVEADDVILAFGRSGESDELNALLPVFKRLGNRIIAVTSKTSSSLAKAAQVVLPTGECIEACPNGLVPTTSTTVSLAIGDALAMCLMSLKNFKPEDFAIRHAGGALGRRLLLKVEDLMIPIKDCPVLDPNRASIEDVIAGLSKHGLGIVLFSTGADRLEGMLTDGDVRRALSKYKDKIFSVPLADLINPKPIAFESGLQASEALSLMENRPSPLNVAPIVQGQKLVGVLRLHELVRVS